MINRKISVHLQDFPDVSFLNDEKDLVSNMDLVRSICSTALSIRDNKNLRVRLPLNQLTVIGKNVARILNFKEIIAEEVNVKNIEIKEEISELAEMKLQVNFKKIGAKYSSKMKEITQSIKDGNWQKISDQEIAIAGINLVDDEFEIKLMTKNQDDKKFVIAALPSNDYLIQLDIEVTKELEEEGIARDIVRAIQQNRKEADLNVSDRINLKIFSQNKVISEVAEKFSGYIKEQTLGSNLEIISDKDLVKSGSKFFFENKIDDGDLVVGIEVAV
jgi:isoleucyl-tRNA synthetase